MPLDTAAVSQMARDYTTAWNSGDPAQVASFYASDGQIIINRGDPHKGTEAMTAMAANFYADVPDLSLTCDELRVSGTHAVFVWTFTGHDANTGNPLKVPGWEEWDLDENLKVKSSFGWFDADDYARQVAGS
ncbi:MAG: nuclear transport factor 2 family protein [Paracoccaceae bacterium]